MLAPYLGFALGTLAYNLCSNSVPYKLYFYSQNNIARRKYIYFFAKCWYPIYYFFTTICNHYSAFVKTWGLAEDKGAMTWNKNKQPKS